DLSFTYQPNPTPAKTKMVAITNRKIKRRRKPIPYPYPPPYPLIITLLCCNFTRIICSSGKGGKAPAPPSKKSRNAYPEGLPGGSLFYRRLRLHPLLQHD